MPCEATWVVSIPVVRHNKKANGNTKLSVCVCVGFAFYNNRGCLRAVLDRQTISVFTIAEVPIHAFFFFLLQTIHYWILCSTMKLVCGDTNYTVLQPSRYKTIVCVVQRLVRGQKLLLGM